MCRTVTIFDEVVEFTFDGARLPTDILKKPEHLAMPGNPPPRVLDSHSRKQRLERILSQIGVISKERIRQKFVSSGIADAQG